MPETFDPEATLLAAHNVVINIVQENGAPKSVLGSTGAVVATTSMVFDDAGRVVQSTGANGHSTSFEYDNDAAKSSKIEAHRGLLRTEGLSATCRECGIVAICGGGAVPHRYASDGFDHPTVYCREMIALITHGKQRVRKALSRDRLGIARARAAIPSHGR